MSVEGFTLPQTDETTKITVNIRSDVYDSDITAEWDSIDEQVQSTSEDMPSDFEDLLVFSVENDGHTLKAAISGAAQTEYTISVISYVQNGITIYP